MEARQRRSVLLPLLMMGIVLVAAVDVFPVRQLSHERGDVVARRVYRAGDLDHFSGPLSPEVVEKGV